MKKYTSLFIICSLLFIICVFSCDLFTGTKVDVLGRISDEKRWADAPKLSVRVEFPPVWGTSEPAQGNITPAMDIRLGYEFSVKFTPDSVYSLHAWLAYYTEDLENLSDSGSWTDNPDLIYTINSIESDDIELPVPDPSGGTFKFTIYTTKPVTLVPSCDTKPRITRTEPLDIKSSGQLVSRASDITLYFNGALDRSTVISAFEEGAFGIWITSTDDNIVTDNKDENWYGDPEYAAVGGFFTVTMNCINLPPPESIMTVTVKGIKNAQGESMDEAGYSFSWKTSTARGIDFISWSAEYIHDPDKNSGNIEISYRQTGADEIKTRCRLNRVPVDDISGNIIYGVPGPDYSGIRTGRQVTGIREYEIIIELYFEGIMENKASIRIWNIPSMKVEYKLAENTDAKNIDTRIIQIRTAEELAAMKDNLGGQYVLANDITVNEKWTPVGAFNPPPGFNLGTFNPDTADLNELGVFHGNFYGNGHTITLAGGVSDGSLQGLFGCAYKSKIRDFTLAYSGESPINISAHPVFNGGFCGGVVGYLKDSSVYNIITTGGGTLSVAASGSGEVSLGGIAGIIDNSFIGSCYAGLNVELNRNGGVGNVGAVAGSANRGNGGSIEININPGKPENYKEVYNLAIDKVTVAAKASGNTSGDALYIGGAVGGSWNNSMRDVIVFAQISFIRTAVTGATCAGGVTGYAENSSMEACSFNGGAFNGNIDYLNKIYIQLGGIIGNCVTNNGDVYINNCIARGNIKIDEGVYSDKRLGDNGINIGGVLGNSFYESGSAAGRVNITNCFFEDGNIKAACSSGSIQAGGFCGSSYENNEEKGRPSTPNSHYFNNCGVKAGTVEIDVRNYGRYIYAGGFISQIWLAGNTSNCFSRANVISKASGDSDEEGAGWYVHQAGGFTGALASGATLSSCYATGTVQSEHNGNRTLAVGGLVGNSGGIIENCYALGNVLADNTAGNGNSSAGGLVGEAFDGEIKYSFSAGQVIAQSKEGMANAGGIVGSGSEINNTAALGKSVTAKSTLDVYERENYLDVILQSSSGRIASGLNSEKSDNNYAFKKMDIEYGDYNLFNPRTREPYFSCFPSILDAGATLTVGVDNKEYWEDEDGILHDVTTIDGYKVVFIETREKIGIPDPDSDVPAPDIIWVPNEDFPSMRDGQDASSGTFLTRAFWETTLGFSSTFWDFSRVARDGHPRLRNVSGQ